MKKLILLSILGIILVGCKVQSMYESEPNNTYYMEDPGMIFYDNYGYYHPYHNDILYYQNEIYDRSRINMDYDFGVKFNRKYRKHPDQKPNYKPIEVKPYQHGTPKQKQVPNEGNKQWGDKIIRQQPNQNNYQRYSSPNNKPSQNNFSTPSRQYTQPNNQSVPTRQGRPVEK